MELINQHTKKIMEECKVRARDAGLSFDNETLEYIVTNKNLIELSPKVMIPTLYDYWVHDVEVLKGHGKYKLYPSNPYETVINSRPAISFYNDNNPDWMNIMIFYHVLAHIDFFQNNTMFEKTWNDDFVGQALADKRYLGALRSEHGRWLDYALEFSRSIDNLGGYFDEMSQHNSPKDNALSPKLAFYFDEFLQNVVKLPAHKIFTEIERFNSLVESNGDVSESRFFSEIKVKYPEFNSLFEKHVGKKSNGRVNVMEFIRDNSPFLRQEENGWIKSVMSIVRNTGLYFEPQIRTKIANEGWASYWHDVLFRADDRIKGHEVAYAKTNAGVTSIDRIGLNPYAIGLRLIQYIEELSNKGKLDYQFQKNDGIEFREQYDTQTGKGRESIFEIRQKFSDFTLINSFVNQEFLDMHDLFVVGKMHDPKTNRYIYYIKSRKSEDYKQMLINSLYHPPKIDVVVDQTDDSSLYLSHTFEGKQLYRDYIADTLLGIEYLWGGQVRLETTEIISKKQNSDNDKPTFDYRRVLYTMKSRKIFKKYI